MPTCTQGLFWSPLATGHPLGPFRPAGPLLSSMGYALPFVSLGPVWTLEWGVFIFILKRSPRNEGAQFQRCQACQSLSLLLYNPVAAMPTAWGGNRVGWCGVWLSTRRHVVAAAHLALPEPGTQPQRSLSGAPLVHCEAEQG